MSQKLGFLPTVCVTILAVQKYNQFCSSFSANFNNVAKELLNPEIMRYLLSFNFFNTVSIIAEQKNEDADLDSESTTMATIVKFENAKKLGLMQQNFG